MHDTPCRRGPACKDAQPGVDPETGAVSRIGADTTHGAPLCETCIRYLGYAVGALHWDVAELTLLLQPAAVVKLRDTRLPEQPRVKLHAPLPFNGNAEALRAFIDHETCTWTEAVVVDTGGDWNPQWAVMTRLGHRVQTAAGILADNLLTLIALPGEPRRAYSTTINPADGHDGIEAHAGGYVIKTRDGLDAATTFFKIHDMVEAFAGRIPSTRVRMRCPRCHQQDMHREHHRRADDSRPDNKPRRLGDLSRGRVVCRKCWAQWSDEEYDALVAAVVGAFGVVL